MGGGSPSHIRGALSFGSQNHLLLDVPVLVASVKALPNPDGLHEQGGPMRGGCEVSASTGNDGIAMIISKNRVLYNMSTFSVTKLANGGMTPSLGFRGEEAVASLSFCKLKDCVNYNTSGICFKVERCRFPYCVGTCLI